MSAVEHAEAAPADLAPTRDLARWAVAIADDGITEMARRWARHALLDWTAVAIAGAREPLAAILAKTAEADGEGCCTIVGWSSRAGLGSAALVNASASHALDYDDLNLAMGGHPSVPVAPALLGLGEYLGRSGRDVLTAFVVGYEVQARLGEMAGRSHYLKGFHATGTIGTFGAAAACGRLLGLDEERMARALGIAATQAAGLKSTFGTMSKPLNAGKAAVNGLIAARLAAGGFTARLDGIERAQGFAATQAPDFAARPVELNGRFAVQDNLFKYHAACYATHAPMEAIKALKAERDFGAGDVEAVTLQVAPSLRDVCDIRDPKTGLDVKFAVRHLVAMAIGGEDTSALATYDAGMAADPRYVALRDRVRLKDRAHEHDMLCHVTVELKDGARLAAEVDLSLPANDLDRQEAALCAKFRSIAGPVVGEERAEGLIARLLDFDGIEDVGELMRATV
jgi:2-methylcitrate dehydratase PrpD